MASRIRVEQIARSLAALGLLAMGLSALVAPRHGFSLDHAVPQSSQANLSRRLIQHEITLHRRSEAETLLMECTRAQMTRHYWGEFAGSLQDLGLSSRPKLWATVDCDAVRTRLWLKPHHGTGLTWQRWSARAVGCACALPWRSGGRRPGRGGALCGWLAEDLIELIGCFFFFRKGPFNQNIIQIDFPSCK